MKHYIINNPQLQSWSHRLSGLVVWLLCWLMWIYLLVPVVTLCGWILGEKSLLQEMRWFGGYKSLLQLMEIYGMTLLLIAALWGIWVMSHKLRKQQLPPAAQQTVNDAAQCQFYQVKSEELLTCRQSALVTVNFDEQGRITQLAPSVGIDRP